MNTKSHAMLKNIPLIALLSLGLVCSPLVANADSGDRQRHSHYEQDRGKGHSKSERRSGHRDYAYYDHYSYRHGHKHGHKHRHHHKKRHSHHDHRHHYQRHHGHDRHRDRHHRRYTRYNDDVSLILGLYSGDLGIIFHD